MVSIAEVTREVFNLFRSVENVPPTRQVEFVKPVDRPEGQQIFIDLWQPPIVPAVGGGEVHEGTWGLVGMGWSF